MVKLDDIPVRTDDECLSSIKYTLTSYSLKYLQIHWLREFPNISIRPKGRNKCADFRFFELVQTQYIHIRNKLKE